MGANEDTAGLSYADQLAEIEERLKHHEGDEALLADVGAAIRGMVDDGTVSAEELRAMLRQRFENGGLRRESHELVETLLDSIAAENMSTGDEKPYTRTMVIETVAEAANETSAPLQVGSVLRDRFLLKQQVTEGSMGVVFKALDRRLAEAGEDNAWVAIKVLHPNLARNAKALRALQQEAAKGRCLSHPNIVRMIDLDREGDTYFLVMEWLEGRSLAQILDDKPGNRMDIDTTLDIVRQVARALDYAHERGVVHADVKPGNLMLTPDGTVKLVDFGVARVRQKQIEGKPRSDPAVLSAGTPAYASMQVLTGEDPTPSDDVFSLACLTYRLIAGYRVFGPRNAADAAEQGMEPQRPQGLGDRQWQALKKALSYARVTRYESPRRFLEALETPQEAPAASVPPQEDISGEPVRKSPWRLAVVGLLIVASVAVVVQTDLVRYLDGLLPAAGSIVDDSAPVDDTAQVASEDPGDAAADAAVVDSASQDAEAIETEPVEDAAPVAEAASDATTAAEVAAPVPESETRAVESASSAALAPADAELVLSANAADENVVTRLVVREDGAPVTLDVVRVTDVDRSAVLSLVETAFDASASPGDAGQYAVDDGGELVFAAGQPRARAVIRMRPDPVREQDVVVTLTVRDALDADTDLGYVELTLEDDDQRNFENAIPPNTVAFAVNQLSVRESDSAAQIDVIRYKADNTPLEVSYVVNDVTARQGEDFFSPALTVIYFGPGQRTARILIPLVQDNALERDEAFMLEIEGGNTGAADNIFSQIAVMIRDDDS